MRCLGGPRWRIGVSRGVCIEKGDVGFLFFLCGGLLVLSGLRRSGLSKKHLHGDWRWRERVFWFPLGLFSSLSVLWAGWFQQWSTTDTIWLPGWRDVSDQFGRERTWDQLRPEGLAGRTGLGGRMDDRTRHQQHGMLPSERTGSWDEMGRLGFGPDQIRLNWGDDDMMQEHIARLESPSSKGMNRLFQGSVMSLFGARRRTGEDQGRVLRNGSVPLKR